MNIKKEKELEILEKKFYNKRLDLSQQQKTEKNFTENNRILNKRHVRDTYSGFQNNYGTTTEPSNLNIYNNTNGNLNQEENNSNNSNNNDNDNDNDNKENKELNGIENELKKENNNE